MVCGVQANVGVKYETSCVDAEHVHGFRVIIP